MTRLISEISTLPSLYSHLDKFKFYLIRNLEDRFSIDEAYIFIFQQLLDDYPKCLIVNADNVGSKQFQQIRQALRGTASKSFYCM